MTRLPVIVGFGGISAAGRSSGHHAYRRTVIDSLGPIERQQTIVSLATMMKLVTYIDGVYSDAAGQTYDASGVASAFTDAVLNGTLIRPIESAHFDPDAVIWQKHVSMQAQDEMGLRFSTSRRALPEPVPANWQVEDDASDPRRVLVTVLGELEAKIDSVQKFAVKAAGQLPTGFDPGQLYNSRFHPRALQMTVVGASDAIHSMGIDWSTVMQAIHPDEVGVYSGNVMSQLDEPGLGGMMKARLKGGRVSTKQCPLGLNTMPADFINAYLLGSVGHTGATIGACATFLYNLRNAVVDINAGRCRVAVVGNAEAPILPEVIDGYATMSALATEDKLAKLSPDGVADLRRSSRPFGENCGFTIAESSQFVILMDDELALELGADIHAAVPDVFVNADGFKKSISAPGAGNYITMAKAVAAAKAIVGDAGLKQSFVQAHGSSTPQNRVTESHILDTVARTFDIDQWPVTAVKAYVGHSLAPASADQMISTLGVFKHGIIPGIKTIDAVADDVLDERLRLSVTDQCIAPDNLQVSFLNSKGFGGNNATATVLSPLVVENMLRQRHGAKHFDDYVTRRDATRAKAAKYDAQASQGDWQTLYHFGQNMIDESEIAMTQTAVSLPDFAQAVELSQTTRYADMCSKK